MRNDKKYKYEPDYAVLPGETLQETLDHYGMPQAELAQRTGKTLKHINGIIKGKAPIVPGTALELERVFGVPASFWNNLEKNYQESLARIEENKRLEQKVSWLERFPIKDLTKLGILPKGKDKLKNFSELLSFYGVSGPDSWHEVWLGKNAAFRKSPVFEQSPGSVSAWLRLGELKAQKTVCQPFDKDEFHKALKAIRHDLLLKDIEIAWPKIVELCAKAGVAVVCVPELNKTCSSGATHWLNSQKAVIQLSFRWKSDDHFWFTFFHEAGHICKHAKKEGYIDDGVMEGIKEKEADKFAAGFLIEKKAYQLFLANGRKSKPSIKKFADILRLPPGVVVGRLQHDGHVPRRTHNKLKAKITSETISNLAQFKDLKKP